MDKRMLVRIGTNAHERRLSGFAIPHEFLQLLTLTRKGELRFKRRALTRASPSDDGTGFAAKAKRAGFRFLSRSAARCDESLRPVGHRAAILAQASNHFALWVAALVE